MIVKNMAMLQEHVCKGKESFTYENLITFLLDLSGDELPGGTEVLAISYGNDTLDSLEYYSERTLCFVAIRVFETCRQQFGGRKGYSDSTVINTRMLVN
ncbi:hypothetical protein TNIN_119771 [Trichonephila inaurata madagascariensis]|uniref:Uncharacterized protein n=1 Tax=Trichonephila inaurata madagascariensis TaxID=2747483 RepID=A0A8X6YHQ1_9ARAC|nr:hypothetical protein TNIN_119771 [Trichonephila inaurata madagascariensis]